MLNEKSSLKILTVFRNYIKKNFPQSISYIINNELFIKIQSVKLLKTIIFLNKHTQTQFKILSDLCSIDYPWKKNRFQLFYNLLTLTYNSRIGIFFNINEKKFVNSLISIYKVAGWFEREIWDLHGIYFLGHNDLRRILTDYGFKGHPLRKDFPLTGFFEVRYLNNTKRIALEEVSLTQDFRMFYFNNNWNKTF
jgi:NADH:ubiquinone oxidoreductase subunit C